MTKKVQHTLEDLTVCQNNLLQSLSPSFSIREKEAQKVWSDLALAEERFLCHKSRIQWLPCGDANTPFFHKIFDARNAANQIRYLLNQTGRAIENISELQSHCVDFFADLFGGQVTALIRILKI